MPVLSTRSENHLKTCHDVLKWLIRRCIQDGPDFAIISGHRNKEHQERLYKLGKTQLHYPDSKHNTYPSMAIDLAPWPLDWDDVGRFKALGGYILGFADGVDLEKRFGYVLRWGGDWNGDWDFRDHDFLDFCHFELLEA